MLLGINDLKQFALPTGMDDGDLARYALADGTTYEQLIETLAAGLAVANDGLINDPIFGGLMSITQEAGIEYRTGAGNGMSKRSEHSRPDPRRAATGGHMLPIHSYDRALGWTFDFLRKARAAQLEADIADALYDMRDNWEKQLLTRFFSSAENAIGAGYDVPFIAGDGGNVDMVPPPYGGQTFAATHTHFAVSDDEAAPRATALNNAAKSLWEHGLFGPYAAIIPFADIDSYTALDNFVKPDRGIEYISTGTSAPYAQANLGDERYIGLYESDYGVLRLWITPHLPTGYAGVYKPFGPGDERNPLRVRVSPDLGAGAVLMRGEGFRQFPLEQAIVLHEFGVGVGQRLNGYCIRFTADGSGTYTDPTIS